MEVQAQVERRLQVIFPEVAEVVQNQFLDQELVDRVVLAVVDEEQQDRLILHHLRERQILVVVVVVAKISIDLLLLAAPALLS
jgi:hypothetical protein